MTSRARWAVAASVVVVLAAAGGAWLWLASGSPAARGPVPPPSAFPSPLAYALDVTLRRVKAIPVSGTVKKQKLRAPAEAVRQTFTDLYATAFVDPARWEGGVFPGLFDHFAPAAREEARRHLDDLTLGRAAEHVSASAPSGPASTYGSCWARPAFR